MNENNKYFSTDEIQTFYIVTICDVFIYVHYKNRFVGDILYV